MYGDCLMVSFPWHPINVKSLSWFKSLTPFLWHLSYFQTKFSVFNNSCFKIGPSQIIQDKILVLRSVMWITKSFFAMYINIYRVQGLECGRLWWRWWWEFCLLQVVNPKRYKLWVLFCNSLIWGWRFNLLFPFNLYHPIF